MNRTTLINYLCAAFLILSLGLLSGYTVGYMQAKHDSFPELKPVQDLNPGVATLKLLKYENGKIYGEIAGRKARIAYSPQAISDLEPGERFEISVSQISLSSYYAAKSLPEGVNYVASKTGKYYYHVLDPRALRVTPKNRIYFQSEEEAQTEGFTAPE